MSDRLILDGKDILTIGYNRLRVDELYLLYHLFRYAEVGDGKLLEEGQVRVAWRDRVGGMEIRASNPAFQTLAESGNSVTRAIASQITLKEHDFFSNCAVAWYQKYDSQTRLNKRYHADYKTLVARCSIGLVRDMLTAPIGILKSLSLRTWQH